MKALSAMAAGHGGDSQKAKLQTEAQSVMQDEELVCFAPQLRGSGVLGVLGIAATAGKSLLARFCGQISAELRLGRWGYGKGRGGLQEGSKTKGDRWKGVEGSEEKITRRHQAEICLLPCLLLAEASQPCTLKSAIKYPVL